MFGYNRPAPDCRLGFPGKVLIQALKSHLNLGHPLFHGGVDPLAQAAPGQFSKFTCPLNSGPDRGSNGVIYVGSLKGTDPKLHPPDADDCQQEYGEKIAFPFSRLL